MSDFRRPLSTSRSRKFAALSGGLAWLLLLEGARALAASRPAISGVAISRQFFNPSLGQTIQISLVAGSAGSLSILILDRDGFPVRRLVSDHPVQPGIVGFEWNGRDDRGEVVPDEAYSLKIDLARKGRSWSDFPGNVPAFEVHHEINYYDRRSGILSYKLSKPARVHVQAGLVKPTDGSKTPDGPVLQTIVNREPRPAGSVVENWNGTADGGDFRIADLPNFAIAIAATSLPENVILSSGNRQETFLERAMVRRGASLFTYSVPDHRHHRGLQALDDIAPRLKATPLNASWSAADRQWSASENQVRLSVSLDGLSAQAFAQQPAWLRVFIDERCVREIQSPKPGMQVTLPLATSLKGSHVVALNWISVHGPVAAHGFRLTVNRGDSVRPASVRK